MQDSIENGNELACLYSVFVRIEWTVTCNIFRMCGDIVHSYIWGQKEHFKATSKYFPTVWEVLIMKKTKK